MKQLTTSGWFGQRWQLAGWLSLTGWMLVAIVLGTAGSAHAQAGRYVLVKTIIDRNHSATTIQNTSVVSTTQVTSGSIVVDCKFLKDDGTEKYRIHRDWTYSLPPSEFVPGQEATIKVSGNASSTNPDPDGIPCMGRFDVGGGTAQGDNSLYTRSDTNPQVSREIRVKAPSGPNSMKKFEINLGSADGVNDYYYEWQTGGAPVEPTQLSARLDCGTLELVQNQTAQSCHIIIAGWVRNTANGVEVVFPKQSDGFGSQDKDGKTGIVVPIGQGTEQTHNMSGARGADGSYGKEFLWTVFVRARGTAPVGTQTIPIIVRQAGGGQVKLELTVRVLAGRSQQSGPRRDGEGAVTGNTGTPPPPITSATSATGLGARLEAGSLVLVPGQMGRSCTIFIKGWNSNTTDPVEVFLPQESKPRGNLDNDLVAFPGGGTVDPANMFKNENGEYPYSLSFRAMERAPGTTTTIVIIVRQKGHEDVRLQLQAVVQGVGGPAIAGGGTGGGNTPTTGSLFGPGAVTRPGGGALPDIPIPFPIGPQPGDETSAPPTGGNDVLDKGMQLEEQQKWAAAEAEYRRVLRLHPKLDEGWNSLGEMCAKQNKWAEAEKAYRQAVKLQPEEGYYYAQLAYSQLKQGRREEATTNAKKAIELGVGDHEVLDELGMIPQGEATPQEDT